MNIKMKKISNYKGQTGATLLELTMVVGIIAVISIAAIAYYNSVSNGNKIKDEVNNLNSLTASVRNMFNSQGDYTGLANKYVLKSSTFPDRMRVPNDAVKIKNSWLTNGVVVVPTNVMGTANDGFTVTYSGVPMESCFDLLSATARHYQVKVGGGAWSEGDNQVDNVAEIDGICSSVNNNTIVYTTR